MSEEQIQRESRREEMSISEVRDGDNVKWTRLLIPVNSLIDYCATVWWVHASW